MMVVTYWTPRMRNAAIAITNTETKNGSPLRNHRSTCRTIWRQREERFPHTERNSANTSPDSVKVGSQSG